MNLSLNEKHTLFSSMITDEILINVFGSTWFFDSIFVFVLTPSCFFGIILNMLSIFIFYKTIHKQTLLYKYLIIYSINNEFICLILFFAFYVYSPRYVGLRFDYFARFFSCILANSILAPIYLFGNLLDILINIDRLSIFNVLFKKLAKININIIITGSILLSIIINIPSILRTYMMNDMEAIDGAIKILHENKSDIKYCGDGLLSTNFYLVGLNIFIRDILSLILEIGLSVSVLIYFRNYKLKKIKLTQENAANAKNDLKLTTMTIYLSMLAIVTHLAAFSLILSLYTDNQILQSTLTIIAFFSIAVKHSYCFFIFYFFDSNFKSELKRFLARCKQKVNPNF